MGVDQIRIDAVANMVFQGRIGVGLAESVEFSILETAQSWRESLAEQGEQAKNMVAGAASVGEMLFDVELGLVVTESVKHIGRLAFARADRQNAVIIVLVRDMAVEFRAGITAVMEIDVATPRGAVAGAEKLVIRDHEPR